MQIDDIIVTANRFEKKDTEATYASEIHNRDMIEASGATSLYDYFAQHTSVTTLPSFGNKVTPLIDMRGYGSENGYQNIVVSVDGRRMNNIDGWPQLIGAIPLGNIDRIEITKGSGSVLYGDGAMSGTIQIYTRNKTGVSVSASGGDHGARTGYITAGIAEQYFDLTVSAADDSSDGYSNRDATGKRADFNSTAQSAKLAIKPNDDLKIGLEGTSSRTDTRFNNYLSLAQFRDDPSQNGGARPYTHQQFNSDLWGASFEYNLTPELKVAARHTQEDKRSEYPEYSFKRDYDYTSNDFSLRYQDAHLSAIAGYQSFDGDMKSNSDRTTKDNSAYFASAEYRWDAFSVSAGARREKVEYTYAPASGNQLNASDQLSAWDLGLNYRYDQATSLFANLNHAFQAPDIDRFFTTSYLPPTYNPVTTFNGFIKPAKVDTINFGLNNVNSVHRFKATAYYSKLHDEIYYNAVLLGGTNTNIDKSHKYGLELQEQYKVNDRLNLGLIYTYTRAIIDSEPDGSGGNYDGRNLPGVPRHGVVANLGYKLYENLHLNLSQVWRSSTYALNDFANNFSQRQSHYKSTNLGMDYRYRNLQWFVSVNNLFEHSNSIQVRDDAIYPVDFSRTWRVGMKADF